MDEFLYMKEDNNGDEFDLGPIHGICLAQGDSVENPAWKHRNVASRFPHTELNEIHRL